MANYNRRSLPHVPHVITDHEYDYRHVHHHYHHNNNYHHCSHQHKSPSATITLTSWPSPSPSPPLSPHPSATPMSPNPPRLHRYACAIYCNTHTMSSMPTCRCEYPLSSYALSNSNHKYGNSGTYTRIVANTHE